MKVIIHNISLMMIMTGCWFFYVFQQGLWKYNIPSGLDRVAFFMGYYAVPGLLLSLGIILWFVTRKKTLGVGVAVNPLILFKDKIGAQIDLKKGPGYYSGTFTVLDVENRDREDLLKKQYELKDIKRKDEDISFLVPVCEDEREWLLFNLKNTSKTYEGFYKKNSLFKEDRWDIVFEKKDY